MSSSSVPGRGTPGSPGYDSRSAEIYSALQQEPEFQELKAAFRRFAFPVTAAFLSWYLLYVLMTAWARDFMDTKLWGNINVALVFGLLQFVSTFVITWLYQRYMTRNVDPLADSMLARHGELHRLGAAATSLDRRADAEPSASGAGSPSAPDADAGTNAGEVTR